MANVKQPFNGIRSGERLNEPYAEARAIPAGLVETEEIEKRETKITFQAVEPPDLEFVEKIFRDGLQVDPGRISSVSVSTTVVATWTRGRG
jgi:hypothetical protein